MAEAEVEVQQASVMRDLEDTDVLGGFSPLKPFGQDYFFRALDIWRAGRTLETEIEVLELGSSTLPSKTWRKSC